MRTYKIYFIRHGITQANLEGRFIGSTDLPLCKQGEQEMLSLIDKYDYPNVGKVYSSPLLRCTQTAALIYPYIEPVIVEDLSEYNFGEFENKTIEELNSNKQFLEWMQSNQSVTVNGAEDMQTFTHRITNALDSIVLDMMKQKISDVAVVTHGGVIMQLLSLCGLPKRKAIKWTVDNAKGYTLLVNASLWGNNKVGEVFSPIPFEKEYLNEDDE